MIFSVSERAVFKRCRRMWDLTTDTRENLEPIKMAPALQLGAMVQAALSVWTEHPETNPADAFAVLSNEALEFESKSYEQRIGAPISEEELDPLYETIHLGLSMVNNYYEHYKVPLPPPYKAVQTEQRMFVAIPNTEHWECNECHWAYDNDSEYTWPKPNDASLTYKCPRCEAIAVTWQSHFLRGTLDTFVQNEAGKLFVLERKTYGNRPEPAKLQHDDQMLAYVWILTQLFGQHNVGGILYDGLWKRAEPPKTKNKRTGQLLTLADLFYREVFIRPPEELQEFEQLLAIEARDMCYAAQHNLIYINRYWMGCHIDCKVERICSAMSRGEDVEYVVNQFYRQRPANSQPESEDD